MRFAQLITDYHDEVGTLVAQQSPLARNALEDAVVRLRELATH